MVHKCVVRGCGSMWYPGCYVSFHLNGAAKPLPSKKDVIFVRPKYTDKGAASSGSEQQAVDVIDLGAPRTLRRAPPEHLPGAPAPRRPYTPNPRLYPGPAAASKPKRKEKRSQGRAGCNRRVFRRPVPNARLYRPAPRRPPPPPSPRCTWPPPAPAVPALDTASRAALRLAARRRPPPPPQAPPSPRAPPSPPSPRSHRLVVTLPPAAATMDNTRHSTSPEDCSDGNDAVSAPSEFLAEFLSAIMQRQYAEALKYCRLILQYEPHNATARGFYPLLQHKVDRHKHNEDSGGACAASRRGSLSDSSGAAGSSASHSPSPSPRRPTPGRWSGSESEEGSVASQSSLELDSSSASPPSSARDSNGNPPPPPPTHPTPDDLENDNDVSATFQDCLQEPSSGAAALRRLRAHFACSIK